MIFDASKCDHSYLRIHSIFFIFVKVLWVTGLVRLEALGASPHSGESFDAWPSAHVSKKDRLRMKMLHSLMQVRDDDDEEGDGEPDSDEKLEELGMSTSEADKALVREVRREVDAIFDNL